MAAAFANVSEQVGPFGEVLWEPSEAAVQASHLWTYSRWLEAREGVAFREYEDLHRFSIERLERFWETVWEGFGVLASAPYRKVLDHPQMPGAVWFPGAKLNYAENLLERHRRERRLDGVPATLLGSATEGEIAVLHSSELRPLSAVTRSQLRSDVAALAAGLRDLGVAAGDRVCAYMPNIYETLCAFLACASIGAVWSSAAPEFGPRAVVDRFAQIEPKVLLAVDGYRYAGKPFDRRGALGEILDGLPTVRHLVLLDYLEPRADPQSVPGGREDLHRLSFRELERRGEGAAPAYEQLPFDHPLWVLYSSGTTGLPKAIVHSHGGMVVEQLKKGYLHLDLHRGERIFWFTTTGWMMWNFLVGCLLTDATIVLYDGAPLNPTTETLWRLVPEAGITNFGTSAGFLTQAMKEDSGGPTVAERIDLEGLRAIGSTGSPLAPEVFRWVYSRLKGDLWLYSTSGGTDVCTAFVGGCPLREVRAGEIQCRALGAAVYAFDERGRPVVEEVGELVVTKPMPSMPIYLWNDPDGTRLKETYFSTYPGVWRHGDWIKITARGTAVIYGRSDATINRGGVRIGTAELYRAVEALPQVKEALVVDVPKSSDVGADLELVLFAVLREGAHLDGELEAEIRRRIREQCSPRHVPDRIVAVPALPRTLSGKLLELPVKRILSGVAKEQVVNPQALADPAALDALLAAAAAAGIGAPSRS
jgi:acetoacetyl-CoA synthetase